MALFAMRPRSVRRRRSRRDAVRHHPCRLRNLWMGRRTGLRLGAWGLGLGAWVRLTGYGLRPSVLPCFRASVFNWLAPPRARGGAEAWLGSQICERGVDRKLPSRLTEWCAIEQHVKRGERRILPPRSARGRCADERGFRIAPPFGELGDGRVNVAKDGGAFVDGVDPNQRLVEPDERAAVCRLLLERLTKRANGAIAIVGAEMRKAGRDRRVKAELGIGTGSSRARCRSRGQTRAMPLRPRRDGGAPTHAASAARRTERATLAPRPPAFGEPHL